MDVTVVVVSWNGRHLLSSSLPAVLAQRYDAGRVHVVVVDNGSTDGTVGWLREHYPQVEVLASPTNLGFAAGNNLALQHVDTPWVALLNNDATPRPGWLQALGDALTAEADLAAVASKVLLPDGRINSVGGQVDRAGYGYDIGFRQPDDAGWDTPREVLVAPATACAVRTRAGAQVGWFDPDHFLYYEDTDLCWRLWLAGWRVRTAPAAVVVHDHSATAGAGSPLHQFHDARNRLLTLSKNATAGLAVREVLRFPLTTASIAVHEDRRRAVVRLRAYASFLRLLPRALRRRRSMALTVPRRVVQRRLG